MNATLHIDGGSRGNPGPAAAGIVLHDTDADAPHAEVGYFLGRMTNNVAEYQALLRGIELAKKAGVTQLQVFSDSQLVVRQVTGEYRVKSPDLKPLVQQVRQRLAPFPLWRIEHVMREHNARADELANLAMDAQADVVVTWDGQHRHLAKTNEHAQHAMSAFTAEIGGKAGQCVAGCAPGNAYTFGATTPEGFCVYATESALAQGPLHWSAAKTAGQVRCERCGAAIRLTRLV